MSEAVHFLVAEECRQLGLRAGAVVFRDLHVGPASAELHAELAREAERIRARYADAQAVRASPEAACFQELLRKVGVNPRKEPPSLEKLLTFALRRGDLPRINSLVDAYNLVSVRTSLSLGAHDLDRIALPITLRLLAASESFIPLGRDTPVPVAAGEYGYVDGAGRILCRLDILQAEFSKVTEATTRALLIIEGTAAHPSALLGRALEDAAAQVIRFCGGTADIVALPD
jgi:DNA/RNA-binding domain of Phe-tRNA-synthetase-like protein